MFHDLSFHLQTAPYFTSFYSLVYGLRVLWRTTIRTIGRIRLTGESRRDRLKVFKEDKRVLSRCKFILFAYRLRCGFGGVLVGKGDGKLKNQKIETRGNLLI